MVDRGKFQITRILLFVFILSLSYFALSTVSYVLQSKAGILSKACVYIQELKKENAVLTENYEGQQRQIQEYQVLLEQLSELKNENALLRQRLGCD